MLVLMKYFNPEGLALNQWLFGSYKTRESNLMSISKIRGHYGRHWLADKLIIHPAVLRLKFIVNHCDHGVIINCNYRNRRLI